MSRQIVFHVWAACGKTCVNLAYRSGLEQICFDNKKFGQIIAITRPCQVRRRGQNWHNWIFLLNERTSERTTSEWKGWRMVSGKFRVSEIFVPISKSRRRFEWVSKSRLLVFLCVSDSRILGCEVSESRIFVFLVNGFDQNHDKIVYLIKNVR